MQFCLCRCFNNFVSDDGTISCLPGLHQYYIDDKCVLLEVTTQFYGESWTMWKYIIGKIVTS